MTTISNKTHKPLSVPLPRGKKLFLSPGKTGQVSTKDAEHPALKKLVESGEIEIVGEGSGSTQGSGAGVKGKSFIGGFTQGSGSHRSGDR